MFRLRDMPVLASVILFSVLAIWVANKIFSNSLCGWIMHNFEKRLIERGKYLAYCDILASCLNRLEDHQQQSFSYIIERGAAIEILRKLCSEFGDNDWPDSMPLADIISNHLEKHLGESNRRTNRKD